MGRLIALYAALMCFPVPGQSFEALQADPWPTVVDHSIPPYLRISFSSQGTEAQRKTAGGVAHHVQWMYCTVENLSDQPISFVPVLVYPTAMYGRIRAQGPEVAAQIVQGTAVRSKAEVAKRLLPVAFTILSLSLAGAGAPKKVQIGAGAAPVLLALGKGAAEARAPRPDVLLDKLIRETLPVVIPAKGVLTGYISALFEEAQGPVSLGIYRYADGSLSIHDYETGPAAMAGRSNAGGGR